MKGAITAMMQAYQGYLHNDGRFVADSQSFKLPTMRRAIVILEDANVKPAESDSRQRATRINKILQSAREVENDGMTDKIV